MTQRFLYRPLGEMFDLFAKDFSSAVNSLSEVGVYDSKFPPFNVYIDEDSLDLEFEFALAGYDKEDVNIEFQDDYLKLEVNSPKVADSSKRQALQHGISCKNFKSRYFVPFSKYETEKAEATFHNGILSIKIPAKEERKPKKLLIQG